MTRIHIRIRRLSGADLAQDEWPPFAAEAAAQVINAICPGARAHAVHGSTSSTVVVHSRTTGVLDSVLARPSEFRAWIAPADRH